MNYEVTYYSGNNEVICYYTDLKEITKAFGLTEREITSYYTSVNEKSLTIESVVKSIKRVESQTAEPPKSEIIRVVFD